MTAVLWLLAYLGAAVLTATAYTHTRRAYHRWQIRRYTARQHHLAARERQLAADVAEARALRELAECEAIWAATATIPTQRRKEDQP